MDYVRTINETIEFDDTISLKQGRPTYTRGPLLEQKQKLTHSANGRLAKDTIVIDRSDASKTVKLHHVDERQPDGSWKEVHHRLSEFPAKRRPGSRHTNGGPGI
jgi:hypothetical protein